MKKINNSEEKYLKYKNKYLNLIKISEGGQCGGTIDNFKNKLIKCFNLSHKLENLDLNELIKKIINNFFNKFYEFTQVKVWQLKISKVTGYNIWNYNSTINKEEYLIYFDEKIECNDDKELNDFKLVLNTIESYFNFIFLMNDDYEQFNNKIKEYKVIIDKWTDTNFNSLTTLKINSESIVQEFTKLDELKESIQLTFPEYQLFFNYNQLTDSKESKEFKESKELNKKLDDFNSRYERFHNKQILKLNLNRSLS